MTRLRGFFCYFKAPGNSEPANIQHLEYISEVATNPARRPHVRNVVTSSDPPPSKCWSVASAYLRAAQAYMLISMPTDTSTIFGVFQAIAGLLLNRDDFLPSHKLIQFKNFASDYFVAT